MSLDSMERLTEDIRKIKFVDHAYSLHSYDLPVSVQGKDCAIIVAETEDAILALFKVVLNKSQDPQGS